MKKLLIFMISITFYCAMAQAKNGCVKDYKQDLICSPAQGSIQKDYKGDLVCGRGQCMKDYKGDIMCSNEDGGFIRKDYKGDLVCTGGPCVQASSKMCREMK